MGDLLLFGWWDWFSCSW